MKFKVGDKVKVLKAFDDQALIGRTLPIIKIEHGEIWLDGSVGSWTDGHEINQWLELVEEKETFKLGDTVRITDSGCTNLKVGTMCVLDDTLRPSGLESHFMWDDSWMEKVEEPKRDYYGCSTACIDWALPSLNRVYYSQPTKKSIMQKLSSLPQEIRRLFDKDQKALYQAGYIDQNGKWTEAAIREADLEISKKYLEDNKAEFVDRAKETIELEKTEKSDCC